MISTRAYAALMDLLEAWEDEKDDYDDDFDYFTMRHLASIARDTLWHMSRGTVAVPGGPQPQPSTIMDDPWGGPMPPPDRETFEGLREQARSFVMRVLRPNLGPGEYIEEVIYRIAEKRAKQLGVPLPPPGKFSRNREREAFLLRKVLAEPPKPVEAAKPLMNEVTRRDVEGLAGLAEDIEARPQIQFRNGFGVYPEPDDDPMNTEIGPGEENV